MRAFLRDRGLLLALLAFAGGCSASTDGGVFGDTATGSATSGAGGAASSTASAGGASAASTSASTTSAGGAGGGSSSSSTGGASSSSGAGGGASSSSGAGGGPPMIAEVFAHSSSTLYKLDPNTKAVTTVGPFVNCSGGVIDIAIDKDGVMFATTFSGLYGVDPSTATCTFVSSGSYPNSLSFVPAGTLDPVKETLVGYNGGTYVRIDTMTGAVTNVGSLGGGYASSGDMVSLINGGSYLTVNGNGCGDCLVSVDPTTGAMTKLIGNIQHPSVFGLAYWGGVAYGFDDAGQLFQIDVTNGSTIDIPIPNAPPDLSFWGAGSTTAAPHM